MTLALIGAGFGRTGTLSLKGALERIDFGPCYHMMEVFQKPEHPALWAAAVDGKPTDWDALFAGYKATVDWPGCHFWRDLAQRYPEAPVLLSVRDPGRWYESVRNTIYKVMSNAPAQGEAEFARSQIGMARRVVLEDTFHGRIEEPDYAIEIFERHNQAVRDAIDPDRLLVYELGQGWQPLCDFFGVPVPDSDFPHANTSEGFGELLARFPPQTSKSSKPSG